MKNKLTKIKNANQLIKNLKNNIKIANICNKKQKESYKGEF